MQREMLLFIHGGDIDIEDFFESLSESTRGHSIRVAEMTARLFGLLREERAMEELDSLPEGEREIKTAVCYHDVGMAMIPERILNKQDDLTGAERRVIQKHAGYGAKLLERYRKNRDLSPEEDGLWRIAAETAFCHHERWDGRGYPSQTLATAIPPVARIAAVADSYDAIVNGAPYRMALPHEYALLEIVDNAGTQFDPRIVEVFKRHCTDFHRMALQQVIKGSGRE